jgi:hypothetical protein
MIRESSKSMRIISGRKIGDQIMDEPVKLYDDAMDAIRYATTYIRQEYYTDDSYYAF